MDSQSVQNGYRTLVVGYDIFQSDRLSHSEQSAGAQPPQKVETTNSSQDSTGPDQDDSSEKKKFDQYA